MYNFSTDIFDINLFSETLQDSQAKRIILFGAGGVWGRALCGVDETRCPIVNIFFRQ